MRFDPLGQPGEAIRRKHLLRKMKAEMPLRNREALVMRKISDRLRPATSSDRVAQVRVVSVAGHLVADHGRHP